MPFTFIAVIAIAVIAVAGFIVSRNSSTPDTTEPVALTDTVETTATEPTTAVDNDTLPAESEATMETDTPDMVDPEAVMPAETMYVNGTYKGVATYVNPADVEYEVTVELTIENDIVTAAEVLYNGEAVATDPNHKRFDGAYEAEVVGVALDDIALSRTGGASLTTGAFNDALAEIKADAAA